MPGTEASDPTSLDLARAAMARHQAARANGADADAIRWLERAHRLVPRDPNVSLALAGFCLSHDPARASELFASVTAEHDVREAWLGLAAARLRLGAIEQALACLNHVLSRHVPRQDTRTIANEVVRAAGADGWCSVQFNGTLVIHARSQERPVIALDGDILTGGRLPPRWTHASRLMVMVEGRHLLGSPIDITAIRRVEGVVETTNGGLLGWARHPADPGRRVELSITDDVGTAPLRVFAEDASVAIPDLGPLAHPFGFAVPATALARFADTLHVRGPDGQPLYGSPIAPLAEQRAATAAALHIARLYPADAPRTDETEQTPAMPMPVDLPPPPGPIGATRRRRKVAVIIPVHGQRALTLACLDSVRAGTPPTARILVIDDASPDSALRDSLDRLARAGHIRLVRNPTNQGFASSVNLGIRHCHGQDVVLLNSDTLVPPGWLERLQEAAYGARDIGTVTPLSNHAGILSYPDPARVNPAPDLAGTRRLDAAARQANGSAVIDIPVGVGFCMFIRRDCLAATGVLRDDVFAQGYGEENDFCLRARRLGWRHVALPSLFVSHHGGQSFGTAAAHLRARNARLLERMHPGYDAMIAAFQKADPIAPARRALDLRRWPERRARRARSVLLITHAESGGVETRIRHSAQNHAADGRSALVMRPASFPDGRRGVSISDGESDRFPNLRFALPEEMPALRRFLRQQRPESVEVHHLLGHPSAVHALPTRLAVPYDVHIHDYAWFCPRVVLIGGDNRYCGEPPVARCQACIADHGRKDADDTPLPRLLARSAALLAGARRVIVPSEDAGRRIARHFPGLRPEVVPHEDDSAIPIRLPRPRPGGGRRKVCVLGAIGIHKGYEVLLACARDAAERNLDLEFVVIGTTIDDSRLMATGRAFVTGSYAPHEAVELVLREAADLAFVPSIAPETWCMTLGELWHAGMRVAAFDIGAPAERIRRTGRGFLLPPHLPPGAINNAFITAMASSEPRAAPVPTWTSLPSDPSHIAAKGP